MRTFRLEFPSDVLFERMLRIVDDAGTRYGRAFPWSFGGGTVLALRHGHRFSKDIDIFVPDPQYLGYLSPRLSDVAASDDPDYEEGAEFLKLRYREGEIDFVVARGYRLSLQAAAHRAIEFIDCIDLDVPPGSA